MAPTDRAVEFTCQYDRWRGCRIGRDDAGPHDQTSKHGTPSAGIDRDARIDMTFTDLLGSSTAVVDLVSGSLMEAGMFYPSGARETRVANQSATLPGFSLEPTGFTGKEEDEEVGLTYFERIRTWYAVDVPAVDGYAVDVPAVDVPAVDVPDTRSTTLLNDGRGRSCRSRGSNARDRKRLRPLRQRRDAPSGSRWRQRPSR